MKPTDELYDPLLSDLFKTQVDEQPSAMFTQAVMDKVLVAEKQKVVLSKKVYIALGILGALVFIAGALYLLSVFLPEDTIAIKQPSVNLKGILSSFDGVFSSVGNVGKYSLLGVGVLCLLLCDLFIRRKAEHKRQHELK